jgi:hypothetical protein
MRTSTTLFTVSFVSAAAAGWVHLDAAQDPDGPARAPTLTRASIDGKEMVVGVDRDRVTAGGKVELSLAMVEAQGGEVRLMVQEQSAEMDSRMETPPRTISSQLIRVDGEGTTVPIELAGMLRDKNADPLLTAGAATRYTLVVASDTDGKVAAALPVFAYEPEAYRLTVEAPTPAGVGEPTDVTVKVENLTDKPLTGIGIGLSSSFITTDQASLIETLAPGEETTVTFRGTRVEAPEEGALLIQAFGWAHYGGTAAAWATVDRGSGALTASKSEPYPMDALGS